MTGGEFWNLTDIYCQPAVIASAGCMLMQALAHAVPCVATDVVGLRSLIDHGQNGLIVPPDDPLALEALDHDPSRAAAGGAAVGPQCASFSPASDSTPTSKQIVWPTCTAKRRAGLRLPSRGAAEASSLFLPRTGTDISPGLCATAIPIASRAAFGGFPGGSLHVHNSALTDPAAITALSSPDCPADQAADRDENNWQEPLVEEPLQGPGYVFYRGDFLRGGVFHRKRCTLCGVAAWIVKELNQTSAYRIHCTPESGVRLNKVFKFPNLLFF